MVFLILNHYPEHISGSFTTLQAVDILGTTQESANNTVTQVGNFFQPSDSKHVDAPLPWHKSFPS